MLLDHFWRRGIARQVGVLALAAVALGLATRAYGLPVVPLPTDPGTLLMTTGGPIIIGPPGLVLPTPFPDVVANISASHHWETEIHNMDTIPADPPLVLPLTLTFPGGPVSGTLTLPSGSSGHLKVYSADLPPEVGGWTMVIGVPPGALPPGPGISVDSTIVELPAGPDGVLPGGGAFAGFGGAAFVFAPPAPGTITLSLIPEPGSLALCAAAAAVVTMRRRRGA